MKLVFQLAGVRSSFVCCFVNRGSAGEFLLVRYFSGVV